jgi:hypothetical protein
VRHHVGDEQDPHVRQLLDPNDAPSDRLAFVVHAKQQTLATGKNHLELIPGDLASGRVARLMKCRRPIQPGQINVGGRDVDQLHQLPVRKRHCTKVSGESSTHIHP